MIWGLFMTCVISLLRGLHDSFISQWFAWALEAGVDVGDGATGFYYTLLSGALNLL